MVLPVMFPVVGSGSVLIASLVMLVQPKKASPARVTVTVSPR